MEALEAKFLDLEVEEQLRHEDEREDEATSMHIPSMYGDKSPSTSRLEGSWRGSSPRRGGAHFDLSKHAKMHLDGFKGELDWDKLVNWIIKLEQYFEIHKVPEYVKVKIMKTKLKGHALLWWQHLKASSHFVTPLWPEFVRILRKKFMPFDMEGQLFRDFQNLRQGPLGVKEYMDKLLELSTKMFVQEDEAVQVMRFINGLNYGIQRELELLEIHTLDRANQVALKVEMRLRKGRESA